MASRCPGREAVVRVYRSTRWWTRLYARLRLPMLSLAAIEAYLPRQGRVVDVGCGYGVLANWLALKYPQCQIVGLDQNEYRIEEARRTAAGRHNIEFYAGDAREALPDCDMVLLTDALHHFHVAEQDRLIAQIHRRLRPGGVLVILDVVTRPIWQAMLARLVDWMLYPRSTKAQFRPLEELRMVLTTCGFEVMVFYPPGWFAGVGFTCRKPSAGESPP